MDEQNDTKHTQCSTGRIKLPEWQDRYKPSPTLLVTAHAYSHLLSENIPSGFAPIHTAEPAQCQQSSVTYIPPLPPSSSAVAPLPQISELLS